MEEEQFLDDSHASLSTTDHRLDRNRFRRDLLLLFTIIITTRPRYRKIILEDTILFRCQSNVNANIFFSITITERFNLFRSVTRVKKIITISLFARFRNR